MCLRCLTCRILQQEMQHWSICLSPSNLNFQDLRMKTLLCWVYRAYQFPNFYNIPTHYRMLRASYHNREEASVWFQEAEEASLFTIKKAIRNTLRVSVSWWVISVLDDWVARIWCLCWNFMHDLRIRVSRCLMMLLDERWN